MILKPILLPVSKYGKWVIITTWIISTIVYLYLHGIVSEFEAVKYIKEAKYHIESGSFSAPRFWFYSVTIFIMIVSLKLKIGMTGAFIMQAILNLFAYLFFYKALQKIFQVPQTAFFVIVYLIIFWPYQSWVVFLFTESVFFSLILILTSIVILYKPDSLKNILLTGIGLLAVMLSRPLGILFIAGMYLYFFYCANKKLKIILAFSSIILLVFGYFVVNTIFSSIKDWTITQAFEQESIICDLPTTSPSRTKLDLASSGSPVYHLLYYVTNNFSHFVHFAGIKLQYFFLMTRPYYSKAHNYFLLFNTIPIYLLMIAGFFTRQSKFNKRIIFFLLSIILIYTLVIIFQCDDYQNRFVLSIYPFFVILAAKAAEYFVLYFLKHSKHTSGIGIKEPVT